MSDIIERIPGYTDDMMLEWCMHLHRIVTMTKTISVGRGRNIERRAVPKHNTHPDVVEKIKRSVEHYRNQATMTFQFRDYQEDIINRADHILSEHGFVYLGMQVRTGKTLTSLGIAEKRATQHRDVNNVLFLTKKKAITSITEDSKLLCPSYALFIINYESMHKLPDISWDLIVMDEAHSMGAFPKPSNRAKKVKELIQKCKPLVILMSGTPTPESYSQMYHQVYGIPNNPFAKYKSFYRWSDDYVMVTQKIINGRPRNNYHNGRERILKEMEPYTINYTQKEAGFKVDTKEHILEVEMSQTTYDVVKRLKKDLVIEGETETLLADTPVKLMQKLHQLYSGTVKFESGNSLVLDPSKAEFIKEYFKGKKIGIFYKFTAELKALKYVFGDSLVTELEHFNGTDKNIALQIVAGREGISLREAEALVYYNIDFSATSYWQSRDRMTTKERLTSDVYWVFAKRGIEKKIYKAVSQKKTYTLNHFKHDKDSL